jgi:tRNA-dihydrouridine synthase A
LASPEQAVEAYLPYAARELARGTRLGSLTRPLIGLFQDRPGARAWRRALAEGSLRPGAGLEVIEAALRPLRQVPMADAA